MCYSTGLISSFSAESLALLHALHCTATWNGVTPILKPGTLQKSWVRCSLCFFYYRLLMLVCTGVN